MRTERKIYNLDFTDISPLYPKSVFTSSNSIMTLLTSFASYRSFATIALLSPSSSSDSGLV